MFYERLVNKVCLTKNIVPIIPQHREMYASYLCYDYIYICKYTQKNIFAAYFCNVFYNVRKCLVSQLKYSVNKP